MKRLFEMTLRKMYKDGEIIIASEGGRRRWPRGADYSPSTAFETFRVWKDEGPLEAPSFDTSMNTTTASSNTTKHIDEPYTDEGNEPLTDLSDEEDNSSSSLPSEIYLPLTPTLLLPHIPRAFRYIASARLRSRVPKDATRKGGAATVGEIREALGKVDERWGRVPDVCVRDALGVMCERVEAWEIHEGVWAMI